MFFRSGYRFFLWAPSLRFWAKLGMLAINSMKVGPKKMCQALCMLSSCWLSTKNPPPINGPTLAKERGVYWPMGPQPGQLSNCHLVLDHRAWLDVQVSMASIPSWSLTKVVSNLICCHTATCWLHGATCHQYDSIIFDDFKFHQVLERFVTVRVAWKATWRELMSQQISEWRWITSSISTNYGHNHTSSYYTYIYL